MDLSQPGESTRVRVDSAGRVVIPSATRDRLGIAPGQDLILTEEGDGIYLRTFDQAIAAAQAAFAPYRRPGISIVDELIRERREEAQREHGE